MTWTEKGQLVKDTANNAIEIVMQKTALGRRWEGVGSDMTPFPVEIHCERCNRLMGFSISEVLEDVVCRPCGMILNREYLRRKSRLEKDKRGDPETHTS